MPDDKTGTYLVSHKSNQYSSYWLFYAIIALTILVIDLSTHAYNYADFANYLIYLSQLVHFPPDNWYYFEALSNYYLLLINWFIDSVDQSAVVAHYLLGLTFLGFLVIVFPPGRTQWQSLIFLFAVFGSLLSFVTLRATPAYFLVALAVRYAANRNPKAWASFIIASLFHTSALLAIIPLLILYFRTSLPHYMRPSRPIRLFVISAILFSIVAIVFPQVFKSSLLLFESVPAFSKYLAYTADSVSENTTTSLSHYIFFIFIVVFTFLFFLFPTKQSGFLDVYVISSFIIYASLFAAVSPVAAVRQAPFWLMPMIGLYPWRRVGVTSAMTPLFVLACIGLFYFQFNQVYLP